MAKKVQGMTLIQAQNEVSRLNELGFYSDADRLAREIQRVFADELAIEARLNDQGAEVQRTGEEKLRQRQSEDDRMLGLSVER